MQMEQLRKDMMAAMTARDKELKGKADGKVINEVVTEMCNA